MTLTELLIYGLAVWRVASLLVKEAGPFDVFQWVRERVGIRHHDSGAIAIIPDNFFAQILSCVWCASLWIALFILFVPIEIAAMLALSAVAILVESTVRKIQ